MKKPKLAVDKENPKTWLKYTSTSCKSCQATCCSMPIQIRFEDLVALNLVSEDDVILPLKTLVAKLKKDKVITAYLKESGLFAFRQTSEGKCRYLIGNKCGVYKNRPLVCRAFPITMGWRHGYCPQLPKEDPTSKRLDIHRTASGETTAKRPQQNATTAPWKVPL